ncbi:MAG TPA: lipopolysaccharide heptosyltransferase II [Pyrinomonadaceae bacterium]|nr:lipopolysaccharide heptosyltransferase II [Pyrinomonadaceae bacterium]
MTNGKFLDLQAMTEVNFKPIERIVVRGTNWVGDAVMTIPALRQLRRLFPDAHITLATRAWAEGLFADSDFLDDLQVHEGSGLRSVVQQVRQWRKRNFDLAILLPNSLETALVASLARVPLRIGYATDGRQALLTHPLTLPEWRDSKHEVFYYLKIIAELEWLLKHEQTFLDTQPDGSLEVSEVRKSRARDFLRERGIAEGNLLVALCPGSINSRAKRWPAERYAALADQLIDELGAQVLLVGSNAEAGVSLEVSRQMRNRPLTLTGQTDLAELVATLSLVDLLVTNDTGPAHIASALGRPTLVIFGPTNPLTTRPFSPFGEIVREPPDCAPCMLRDCPIDHRCMTAITPADVFERARSLLTVKPELACHSTPLAEAINKLKFAGQLE